MILVRPATIPARTNVPPAVAVTLESAAEARQTIALAAIGPISAAHNAGAAIYTPAQSATRALQVADALIAALVAEG